MKQLHIFGLQLTISLKDNGLFWTSSMHRLKVLGNILNFELAVLKTIYLFIGVWTHLVMVLQLLIYCL